MEGKREDAQTGRSFALTEQILSAPLRTIARTVAVKIWEAETFSDGTALSEWAANRVASVPGHPALVEVLGTFEDRTKRREVRCPFVR